MTSSRMPDLRLPPAMTKLAAWIRPTAADASELPLTHRLAIAYLMLPVVIWLIGWFEWWVGIPAAILLIAAFWHVVSGTWRWKLPVAAAAVIAMAACWVMLTAAGGVFDAQNGDWIHQHTTHLDLARYPWPTFLPNPLAEFTPDQDSPSPLLRYYLGYYITPALLGKWLGLGAMNWAVPLWTWIGVALILLMFTRERRGWGIALAAVFFILFGGMDILRVLLTEGWDWIDLDIKRGGLPGLSVGSYSIEWLGNQGFVLQYSSNMTSLMWVPQHFIPAGLYALLMLQLRRHRRFLAVSGVLAASGLFWSAFVPIGLLPLIAALLWENGIRPFLRWPNLLLAAPLAALIALYLTSGSTDFQGRRITIGETDYFQGRWIWEGHDWPSLIQWAMRFYLFEFLLLVVLLLIIRPKLRREPFFIASAATLILLPLYMFGLYNDLPARASLPPLILLCWFSAETIAAHVRTRAYLQWRHSIGIACIAAVLAIGSVTAFVELARAQKDDGWRFRHENINYTALVDLGENWLKAKTAYDIPAALLLLLDDDPQPRYEGMDLIIQSEFDIYRDGTRLIYTKKPCNRADTQPRFFLHVIPVDQADLPGDRRQHGFDNLDFNFGNRSLSGGLCFSINDLPYYEIAKIVTGQFTSDGRIWSDEAIFNDQ